MPPFFVRSRNTCDRAARRTDAATAHPAPGNRDRAGAAPASRRLGGILQPRQQHPPRAADLDQPAARRPRFLEPSWSGARYRSAPGSGRTHVAGRQAMLIFDQPPPTTAATVPRVDRCRQPGQQGGYRSTRPAASAAGMRIINDCRQQRRRTLPLADGDPAPRSRKRTFLLADGTRDRLCNLLPRSAPGISDRWSLSSSTPSATALRTP